MEPVPISSAEEIQRTNDSSTSGHDGQFEKTASRREHEPRGRRDAEPVAHGVERQDLLRGSWNLVEHGQKSGHELRISADGSRWHCAAPVGCPLAQVSEAVPPVGVVNASSEYTHRNSATAAKELRARRCRAGRCGRRRIARPIVARQDEKRRRAQQQNHQNRPE